MNKKGQALVEFVIILPVFLVLVLGIIDIGNILYNKNRLEGILTDAISMYDAGKSTNDIKDYLNDDKVDFYIDENSNILTYHLTKKIDIITPGLNLIFDNPYLLDVKRSVYNE